MHSVLQHPPGNHGKSPNIQIGRRNYYYERRLKVESFFEKEKDQK